MKSRTLGKILAANETRFSEERWGVSREFSDEPLSEDEIQHMRSKVSSGNSPGSLVQAYIESSWSFKPFISYVSYLLENGKISDSEFDKLVGEATKRETNWDE